MRLFLHHHGQTCGYSDLETRVRDGQSKFSQKKEKAQVFKILKSEKEYIEVVKNLKIIEAAPVALNECPQWPLLGCPVKPWFLSKKDSIRIGVLSRAVLGSEGGPAGPNQAATSG